MQLDSISSKRLNEIEQSIRELQILMRKASLQNEPVAKAIHDFEVELGKARRARFDAANPEYIGY